MENEFLGNSRGRPKRKFGNGVIEKISRKKADEWDHTALTKKSREIVI